MLVILYLYDEAICEDLQKSFSDEFGESIVKVISPENIFAVIAQIKNDEIPLPVVSLYREPSPGIDSARCNFTWLHTGVQTCIDPETNTVYHEKSIPVTLSYKLTALCASTVELDEIVRELLFKYTSMYFLTIQLPYESNRKIRFGVTITPGSEIDYSSGSNEYQSKGSLHQAVIPLTCEGCVEVTYRPVKLNRKVLDTEIKY